jgi:RNA polymerase sigma factor (sigma-70 family)
MPTSPLKLVIQRLRAATERGVAGSSDGELLTRFLSYRDNDALAALVHRHAPMVWGVCRRLLRNPHDAEDAFQATFLVLVRKATTVMPREMVGNWLYGVAHQTAVRLRATAAKRGVREMQMMEMPEPVVAEARGDDLLVLLDQELSCLPEKYRVLIVLCDLESKTRIEVARQLAIPEGTVASRLVRARIMLAKRLTKRRVALSGGALAAVLSEQAASAGVPNSVVVSTIKAATLFATGEAAATGAISVKVAALTEGVMKAMLFTKLKAAIAVVLILGVVVTGATILTCRTAAGQDDKKPVAEKPVEPAAQQEKEAFTAWGKEVGGLQAGLGFRPGEHRAYSPGETVKLVVRVRNVSKEEVKFSYFNEEFYENPPAVTDDGGKPVPLEGSGFGLGLAKRIDVNLAPGKEVDLCEVNLVLRPASEKDKERPVWKLFGTGKFQLKCNKAGGNIRDEKTGPDPILGKLHTGKLEIEVKEPGKPKENDPMTSKDEAAGGKEVSDLQGEWVVVAMAGDGTKASAESLKGMKWVVKGNQITASELGASGKMSFKLDPERTPKEIDITSLDGNLKGTTSPGIYSVEGHRLRICMGNKVRPKEYSTTLGDGRTILTLEKEAFTAWGKEVNGVQIGIRLGENRVYKVGETVTLIIRLRNNGKTEVPFFDNAEYFQKNPPLITDANNKAVTIKKRSIFGFIKKSSVAPGKEVDLIRLEVALRAVTDREKDVEWTLYGTGKFHIKYEGVPVVGEVGLGSPGMTLTTGRLELEVKEAEKPSQTGLPKPKVEKKKVYTPDEVILAQENARGKAIDSSKSNIVAVEFKVQAVTKPTQIKVNTEKDSPYVVGHGPDDLSLHPQPPRKFEEKQFTAILTSKVVKQLQEVGIQDVGKHFMEKTIRVSGRINQHNYSGDDPPIEPHYDLVIEDVSQIETVD